MSSKTILACIKRLFSLLPRSFWIREFTIAAIIFSGLIYIGYTQQDLPFNLFILFLVNAFLFHFTKYLALKGEEWFYLVVYQAELNQIYRQIGCLTVLFKGVKNIVFFFFSILLGWIGLVLILLTASKSEVK